MSGDDHADHVELHTHYRGTSRRVETADGHSLATRGDLKGALGIGRLGSRTLEAGSAGLDFSGDGREEVLLCAEGGDLVSLWVAVWGDGDVELVRTDRSCLWNLQTGGEQVGGAVSWLSPPTTRSVNTTANPLMATAERRCERRSTASWPGWPNA